MANLITFTPYLGDTFLTSAVARKIGKVTGKTPHLIALNSDMAQIIVEDWGGSCVMSPIHSEFIKEGSLWGKKAELQSFRRSGEWIYQYNCSDMDYVNHIEWLCEKILRDFRGETVYTLHNTFPHAMLGKMAKKMGYKVRGYFLASDFTLYTESPNGIKMADIWTNEFIGDRISKYATGQKLDKEDFKVMHPSSSVEQNTVTLFPTTRSVTQNAGNWETDIMYLTELGYNVRVAVHESEIKKQIKSPLVSQVTFIDVKSLVHLITSSEFIICNDSIAFHLAWYYGKEAIVKMKAGFNREWQPRWTRDNSKFYFIPPSSYFEEEYLYLLQQGIEQIT